MSGRGALVGVSVAVHGEKVFQRHISLVRQVVQLIGVGTSSAQLFLLVEGLEGRNVVVVVVVVDSLSLSFISSLTDISADGQIVC